MEQRARRQTWTRRGTAAVLGALAAVVVAGSASAQDARSVGDADNTRTVLVVVLSLVVLGVALAAFTVWFWRTTRPEHPALAPLEVMGGRRFGGMDAWERRAALDAVRPDGAETPVRPVLDDLEGRHRRENELDLQQLVRHTPTSFEDLVEAPASAPASTAVSPASVTPVGVPAPPVAAASAVPPPTSSPPPPSPPPPSSPPPPPPVASADV